MTRLSPRHPRYGSLQTRALLAEAVRTGLAVPEGLIAHGRAEAFDYFLGERTIPSARRAERVAARWLAAAKLPVVSVNGNVAALAPHEVARLARALPRLKVEVNLFHRTEARVTRIARILRRAGVREVFGLRPTARIPALPSDRAKVDRRGIWRADVCLVPLEDGDRAGALRRMGKRVIAIDLNPFSRTSRSANLPIVDELRRALGHIADDLEAGSARGTPRRDRSFAAAGALEDARRAMGRRLGRAMVRRRRTRRSMRSSTPRARGIGRRNGRTR
ncbi:MAG: phosphopantothenate/pantothenate synthetase [Thermoplasmata archaeon]|nr:phosphopantothenate/pantothenate synthetase [Thermoplasmata archaeon]